MSLRIVKKILKKVNSHAEEMSKLSDNQLKDKTQQFKRTFMISKVLSFNLRVIIYIIFMGFYYI